MRFLKPALLVAALAMNAGAIAQGSYHAPKNIQFDSATDYMSYKQDVIAATSYLKALPRGRETVNRMEVMSFLSKWMAGSPDVTIKLMSSMLTPLKDDADLVMLFMAAWSSHALETGNNSMYACNAAAAKAVVDYYKNPANKVPRNKQLDVWVKKQQAGKLESYVTGLVTAEERGRNAEE